MKFELRINHHVELQSTLIQYFKSREWFTISNAFLCITFFISWIRQYREFRFGQSWSSIMFLKNFKDRYSGAKENIFKFWFSHNSNSYEESQFSNIQN